MIQRKAFILMDLLLGLVLLMILASAFTRISLLYKDRCRQLSAIRRRVRLEALGAYARLSHPRSVKPASSAWRPSLATVQLAKISVLPAGFHWMAMNAVHGGKSPTLFYLSDHGRPAEPGAAR